MLSVRASAARDGLRLPLAILFGLASGAAVAEQPTLFAVGTAVVLGAVACLILPPRHFPALLAAVTVVMPSLVLEGISGSGQARAIMFILVLALARVLIARPQLSVPPILPLAVGLMVALLLMTMLVAIPRPAWQVGDMGDFSRALSYPAAAVIGFIGGAHARQGRAMLSLARAFAWVGLLAALGSLWYWSWLKLHLPPLSSSLFGLIKTTSPFPLSRSVFPFVEDSPNLGAVLCVMLAAFAAPPLVLAGRRRDRVLAAALAVAAVAAVLTTQSRTGLIAGGLSAVVFMVLAGRVGGRRATVLLVLAALSGGVVYTLGTFSAERLSGDTLHSRVQIWEEAGHSAVESPIIGHGFEYSLKGNFSEGALNGALSRTQSTHSDMISVLVDGGIVGAVLLASILMLMFKAARQGVRDPVTRPLGVGYACALAAAVVSGLDNTLTQSAAACSLEWLLFGVIVGAVPRWPARTSRGAVLAHRASGGAGGSSSWGSQAVVEG